MRTLKTYFVFLSATLLLAGCSVSGGPSLTKAASISSDSALASLGVSAGALSPAFSTTVQSYTVTVPYASSTFMITPASRDGSASISVATNNTASGQACSSGALTVGSNVIPVVVTAADGTTTSYTLTVTRAAPATDATLSSLAFTAGALSPTFSPSTTTYTLSISDLGTTFAATPVTTSALAQGQVVYNAGGSQSIVSGTTSSSYTPNSGSNTLTYSITAEDGSTKTYTINITYGICASGLYSNTANGCVPVGRGNYSTGDDNLHTCSNSPVNSHYTSTQATNSNCPWSCDDGYLTTNGTTCSSYPNARNLTCDDTEVAVGIYGRSGDILDRLGVRCATFNADGTTGTPRNGPTYGGNGGGPFNYDGTYDCPAGSVLFEVNGNLANYYGVNRTGQIRYRCKAVSGGAISNWLPSNTTYWGINHDRAAFDFLCGTSPNNYGSYVTGIIIDNSSGAAYTGDTLGINCR